MIPASLLSEQQELFELRTRLMQPPCQQQYHRHHHAQEQLRQGGPPHNKELHLNTTRHRFDFDSYQLSAVEAGSKLLFSANPSVIPAGEAVPNAFRDSPPCNTS